MFLILLLNKIILIQKKNNQYIKKILHYFLLKTLNIFIGDVLLIIVLIITML